VFQILRTHFGAKPNCHTKRYLHELLHYGQITRNELNKSELAWVFLSQNHSKWKRVLRTRVHFKARLSFEQLGKFLAPRVCTRLCSRDSSFDARRVLRQRNLTVKYCKKVISTYTLGSSGYIFFFLQEFTKCFLILRSVKRLIMAVCVPNFYFLKLKMRNWRHKEMNFK